MVTKKSMRSSAKSSGNEKYMLSYAKLNGNKKTRFFTPSQIVTQNYLGLSNIASTVI